MLFFFIFFYMGGREGGWVGLLYKRIIFILIFWRVVEGLFEVFLYDVIVCKGKKEIKFYWWFVVNLKNIFLL